MRQPGESSGLKVNWAATVLAVVVGAALAIWGFTTGRDDAGMVLGVVLTVAIASWATRGGLGERVLAGLIAVVLLVGVGVVGSVIAIAALLTIF